MSFIKTIFDRISLLNKKGLGTQYTPEQIGQEVHSESMNLWKKYIVDFEKTQMISVYLKPLQGKETVALTSGAGTLATALDYITAVMIPSTDIVVDIVDIAHWGNRVNHSIKAPSATYPIIRIDNTAVVVRPTTLTSVDVHYIKKPTKPVYAYTIVDDEYVPDDGSSVDFEWHESLHDDIMNRVLSNLGFAQREGEAIQYSNLEKQTEGR